MAIAPSSGCLFGAAVSTRGSETYLQAVQRFERIIGKTLRVPHFYHGFTTGSGWWSHMAELAAGGRIPAINFIMPQPWRGVSAGNYDSELAVIAGGLAKLGPSLVTWTHEPETKGTPSDYIAAYRHCVNKVKPVAAQTEYVFAPMEDSSKFAPFYPGDTYVDWICPDTYNWFGKWGSASTDYKDSKGHDHWTSLDTEIRKWWLPWAEQRVQATGGRIKLGCFETGCSEDPKDATRRRGWLEDIAAAAPAWTNYKLCLYYHDNAKYLREVDNQDSSLPTYVRCVNQDGSLTAAGQNAQAGMRHLATSSYMTT